MKTDEIAQERFHLILASIGAVAMSTTAVVLSHVTAWLRVPL